MDKLRLELDDLLKKINLLNTEDPLIMEQLMIDLNYLYKKYDKKINPKYINKFTIKNINVLIYNSGINLLLTEDFDEKVFWDLTKTIVKNPSFTAIKIRKNKDFSTTTICTSKNIQKIKSWFSSNLIDYEILSVFFMVKDKDELVADLLRQKEK